MAFVTPVVEHWLEREMFQWIHREESIRGPNPTLSGRSTTEIHLAQTDYECVTMGIYPNDPLAKIDLKLSVHQLAACTTGPHCTTSPK